MAIIGDNINSFDNVLMLQSGSNTELGGDFLLILPFSFACAFWAELLDSENTSAILGAGFDETDGSTSAASKHTTPFAILLGEVSLGSILKRNYRMGTRGGKA